MKLKIPKSWYKSRLHLEEGEIGAGFVAEDKAPRVVRCGRTRKVGYRSHDAAMLGAAWVMARPDCNAHEFRAYHCTYCGLWHLTSKA